MQQLYLPLFVFMCTGMGFMVLEVSIFQKLILYLGSPTVSLSILLASILLGMGIGSYFGGKIFLDNPLKRLTLISLMIVIVGVVLFLSYQPLLNELMSYTQVFCSIVCFFLILPFGFLLGIPFPTGIQILKQNKMEKYIPWMYGVNGILTVLGSISAVILSMTFGFNITFLTGLAIYFILFIILIKYSYGSLPKTIASISEH
jgi:MFS family permease